MYKISEFSKITGISIPTLRYYEELGILNPIRKKNGYREYSDVDLEWFQFIKRLKETGMELSQIQKYSAMRAEGESTIDERIELLDQQEKMLQEQKEEIDSHIQFLQKKQEIYRELLRNRDAK
jgi:DNA-binding transcriptional MerR regulator